MTLDSLASKVLVFGVPSAIALCAWGLAEIIDNGKNVVKVLTHIEDMQKELVQQDGRIDRLENQYFGNKP